MGDVLDKLAYIGDLVFGLLIFVVFVIFLVGIVVWAALELVLKKLYPKGEWKEMLIEDYDPGLHLVEEYNESE